MADVNTGRTPEDVIALMALVKREAAPEPDAEVRHAKGLRLTRGDVGAAGAFYTTDRRVPAGERLAWYDGHWYRYDFEADVAGIPSPNQ